ncbi:MAG: NADH-quinone oxidoreductase subunit L [Rhodobacteraceae bacterium]|nr:NADH-quinone oxidoreductase subunit L [Paracoccaceae bacterium]
MYAAIVFLPLVGALLAGFFGKIIGDRGAHLVTCIFMAASMLLGAICFYDVALQQNAQTIQLFTWIESGNLKAEWALKIDTLTAIMILVVTSVSTMVHVYSIGYMHHDPHNPRFFAYLSLFTFAMLMLVTADNLVQMFFGWEGVGLASYLLIGFWYQKPEANAAAIKAFLVNRVGDFGFALGIFGTYLLFDTIVLDEIFILAPKYVETELTFLWFSADAITVLTMLLFIGAMGKSAQLGLHTWLPDAMEGPTPVSALIHAATMVTAGVFMIARLSPMMEYAPDTLTVVTLIGASTAIFAASVGLCQNDIKRVIAYSTCSQLGYMFFACGVSAYSAGIYHLLTHAFFKALLFLGAGSVIHAMSDEQDMRKMGGLRKRIPLTYWLMIVGTLALTGFPFLSGFYSKDLILEATFARDTGVGYYAFYIGIFVAGLTAFYSWRLIFMTFHGECRAPKSVQDKIHESPLVMTLPLIFLAIGALFAGKLGYEFFGGESMNAFWGTALLVLKENTTIEAAAGVPLWVVLLPTIMFIFGTSLAFYFYLLKPDLPKMLSSKFSGIYQFLLNKWYFDELYDLLFVRSAFRFGHALWKKGDGAVIDGLGPDGISSMVRRLSGQAVRLQSGFLYHYAFAMMIGLIAFASWYIFGFGN